MISGLDVPEVRRYASLSNRRHFPTLRAPQSQSGYEDINSGLEMGTETFFREMRSSRNIFSRNEKLISRKLISRREREIVFLSRNFSKFLDFFGFFYVYVTMTNTKLSGRLTATRPHNRMSDTHTTRAVSEKRAPQASLADTPVVWSPGPRFYGPRSR